MEGQRAHSLIKLIVSSSLAFLYCQVSTLSVLMMAGGVVLFVSGSGGTVQDTSAVSPANINSFLLNFGALFTLLKHCIIG
jgi:hypothetical protein